MTLLPRKEELKRPIPWPVDEETLSVPEVMTVALLQLKALPIVESVPLLHWRVEPRLISTPRLKSLIVTSPKLQLAPYVAEIPVPPGSVVDRVSDPGVVKVEMLPSLIASPVLMETVATMLDDEEKVLSRFTVMAREGALIVTIPVAVNLLASWIMSACPDAMVVSEVAPLTAIVALY